ncbi:MAG TPA: DUF1631 domain-containing protein [Chromatiales bacterium]|nr:DUF1631 domain-containing protein [Chromatiales bacterium]
MAMHDNIVSFSDSVASSRRIHVDPQKRRAIDACRDSVVRTLPHLMNGMFEKLDDTLYELADKADNNKLQTTYFEAMREMRKVRDRVDRRFREDLLRQFDDFWVYGPKPVERSDTEEYLTEDDLSLIDDDEMEETLAVTNMVSKNENRYQRELHALDERFSYLLGGHEVACDVNPLGPAILCRTFRETMRGVDVDIPVRLVIYKLFDRQVMHYIGGMYDEINTMLVKMGVLPKLVLRRRHNPVAPSVRRTARAMVAPQPVRSRGEREDGAAAGEAEVFAALRQLLDERRGEPAAVDARSSITVTTQDLLSVLSDLQQTSREEMVTEATTVAEDQENGLREVLLKEIGRTKAGDAVRSLGQMDDDTIDVISMLFEFILEDGHLPDAMKALISRLQIPILKVAILDKTFFSKKLHPARRLLNTLAQAAVGWTDDGDRSENGLYGRVERIVSRVLNEFNDDPALFDELNTEFSAYLEQEQRGAQVAEERTNQVTRGKEQLEVAKQVVAEEIAKWLEGRAAVPEVVLSILNEGWKDVLLLIYLRQGKDSEEWMRAVELMEKLLWSVEPKMAYDERQTLLRRIPELLKGLREGLDSISFDQHKTARLFKELQACHIACLRGDEVEAAEVGDRGRSFIQATSATPARGAKGGKAYAAPARRPKPKTREAVQSNKQVHELVSALNVGTWVEIKREGEPALRVKLSWRSDMSDTYVFVDRKGIKRLELHAAELADAFSHAKAVIIRDADVPIMDRALAAMMKSLKGPGGGGSTSHASR